MRALFFLALLLSSCAAVGNKAITDPKVTSKIEKGKTTKAEISKLLGSPSSVDFSDDGRFEKWVYVYTKSQVRGASFIPIVGSFAGGTDVRMDTLTIQFSEAGIVQNLGKGVTTGGGGGLQDSAQASVPMKEPVASKEEPKTAYDPNPYP